MEKTTIHKEADWRTWLFATAVNIVPFLSTTGLIPQFIRILGPNVQSIVLLIPLLIPIGRWPKLKQPYSILTAITVLYVIYKFMTSCMGLGFIESFTNFRYNFLGIIPFFMAVIYIHTLSEERIFTIIRLIIILTVIEAILFIAHVIGILNIYNGLVAVMSESNIKITRIYMGYPPMLITVYAISVILYAISHKRIFFYIGALLMLTVFVSYTRSFLGEILIVTFLLFLFAAFKFIIKITSTFKLLMAGLAILAFMYVLLPSSFSFWESRFYTTSREMKDEQGTYAFRKLLIESAHYQASQENKELEGLGYRRDSRKGAYSFVQGGDTFIPPVIYCEGLIGILLRVSIVAAVLINGFCLFFKNKSKDAIAIACVIIAILMAQCVNYMQTNVFTQYINILLPLIILIRLYHIKNMNRTKDINK